jgi:site-specific DNA-methyltransferase (adenine-specific)
MNKLLFGDNLNWLRNRENFPDVSIDLIYLDPPFNSKRDYAVIFKSPKGYDSEAQAEAFKDTWHWTQEAEREFDEIIQQSNQEAAAMIQAFRSLLGVNDMMAYLTRMTIRLLELHRVLKSTGSLYLHCDPTASHYLKIVLDCIFGKENFRSEINWRRQRTQ